MSIDPRTSSFDVRPNSATLRTSIQNAGDVWLTGAHGNVELGASVPLGGGLTASAYVNAWRDFIGGGATIGALLPCGATLGAGGYLSISSDRTVKSLGEHAGQHRVEIADRRGLSGRVSLDVGYCGIGAGGRWGASTKRAVVYRTDLPRGESPDAQALPDLRNPLQSMRIADEVVMATEGEMFGSVLLGAQGLLSAGVLGSMKGTFDLEVQRLDETHMQVTVQPRSIKEIGLLAEGAGFVTAKRTHTVALAMRQSFVFDLDCESGREAYLRTLRGELPTGFSGTPGAIGERDAEHLLDAVKREELPPGVTRVFLEKIDVRSRLKRVGGDFSLVFGDRGGLSYEKLRSIERVVATDGLVAIAKNTAELSRRWELLFSGEEKASVTATHERTFVSPADGEYAWSFDRLILRGRLSDSSLHEDEQNREMVDVLNRLFGLELRHTARRGHGQDREVIVERELGSKDLDRIARATPDDLRRAAVRTGVGEAALVRLRFDLTNIGPDQAAEIVQRFVGKHGLPAFGAIHAILDGDPDRLSLSTSSSAYTAPLSRALMLFSRPFRPDDPRAKVDAFFHEARAILRDIDEGLKDLEDDPFIVDPADAEARRQALLETKRAVESMLDLERQGYTREERLAIYAKLRHKEIEQRLVVLKDMFPRRIAPDDDKLSLERRFAKVERALRKLKRERTRLDSETADRIERELRALIDLSQLTERERRELLDAVRSEKDHCLFRSSRERRVLRHLQ